MPTPTNTNDFLSDIDPALLGMPGMSEAPQAPAPQDQTDQGAKLETSLKTVMPFQQFEALAVDPSLSKEAQAAQDEKFFRAVGQVSLAAETLNYDDLMIQVQTEKVRASATRFATEQQQAMDVMDPFGTKAKKEKDEKQAAKSRYALAA